MLKRIYCIPGVSTELCSTNLLKFRSNKIRCSFQYYRYPHVKYRKISCRRLSYMSGLSYNIHYIIENILCSSRRMTDWKKYRT